MLKRFTLLTILFFATNHVWSQDSLDFENRYYFAVQGFFPTVKTELLINPENSGVGTFLSIEDIFKLNDRPSLVRFEAKLRLTKRSSFNVNFYNLVRKGHREYLSDTLTIGDTTISASASLDTKFTTAYMGLTYEYSVFRQPNWNGGLSVGLRALSLGVNFKAKLNQYEGEIDESIVVPVVLFGMHINGYLLPRLRGGYSFEVFTLTIEGIKGTVYDTDFFLEYYFIKNLGAGFGFHNTYYNIKEFPVSSNFNGEVNFQVQGVNLFLKARF